MTFVAPMVAAVVIFLSALGTRGMGPVSQAFTLAVIAGAGAFVLLATRTLLTLAVAVVLAFIAGVVVRSIGARVTPPPTG